MILDLIKEFREYRRNKHLYNIEERKKILLEFDKEFLKIEGKNPITL